MRKGFKGFIIDDWGKVRMVERAGGTVVHPDDRGKVFGAVQHFLRCDQLPEVKAAIQHFGTSADFPASVLETISKYHLVDDFDMAWQVFFDVKDFRNSKRDGFKILDVGHGLMFKETPVGGEAEIYKMAGEIVTVNFAKYSGGLGWPRELFDDEEFWTIEDNAKAFRNAFHRDKAAIAYGLIDALPSGENVAWAAAPGSVPATEENYEALRDMNTMRAAVLQIVTDNKDKPYGIGPSTVFQLLAPLALMPRIQRALGVLNKNISGDLAGVPYTIKPSYTLSLAAQDVYYIGVKGIKSIWGERKDLEILDQFDIMSYSDVAVGWARFAGAIGDIELLKRCATA